MYFLEGEIMIKEILQYQDLDAKLVSIEKEIANSPAKLTANKMVEYVKSAQKTLVSLEQNASNLIAEFDKLNEQYQSALKDVDKMTKQKLDSMSVEELREKANLATQINSNILTIERNISLLSDKIATILKDFEKTKKQAQSAKLKFEHNKTEYLKFVATKQESMHKLRAELAKVEKSVDKDILKKYKELRADNKFPIFVPLVNEACGGCVMHQPRARLDELKTDKILECENCHRIIYLPEYRDK